MTLENSEIRFYVDTLIVEAVLSNNNLTKTAQAAGFVSDFIEKTKNYFANHIDPEDKSGSLLNILAPGAISMAFSAMGMGWIGMLFGAALRIFNIDIKDILTKIYNGVKNIISGGKPVNSSQVQEIVDQAIEPYNIPDENETVISSIDEELNNARMLKVALIEYETHLTKVAGKFTRRGTTSVLTRILGWFFKIALASAGLLVAGDVVNKFLGRPNAFDNTIQKGHPIATETETPQASMSSQTKFKVTPGFVDSSFGGNWIERVPNTESGIKNLILSYVHQVYDGVNDVDVTSSNSFNKLVDDIAWYNHASAGDQAVFIPRNFTSKKQLVDHFIDEVAAKSA